MLKLWKKKENIIRRCLISNVIFRESYMFLKFNDIKGCLIIKFIGELDHHSAEEVRVKIDDRIDRDNIKKVIMDFSNVTFMDSSGIGVVIGRYKKIKSRNGIICIASANMRIDKVFQLSGIYKIIDSYKNVDEAMKNI